MKTPDYTTTDRAFVPCRVVGTGWTAANRYEELRWIMDEIEGVVPRWVADLRIVLVDDPDAPKAGESKDAAAFETDLRYARLTLYVHSWTLGQPREVLRWNLYHELIEAALFPAFDRLESIEAEHCPPRFRRLADDRDAITQHLVAVLLHKMQAARDATIKTIEETHA